jgi:hypothetical protein
MVLEVSNMTKRKAPTLLFVEALNKGTSTAIRHLDRVISGGINVMSPAKKTNKTIAKGKRG